MVTQFNAEKSAVSATYSDSGMYLEKMWTRNIMAPPPTAVIIIQPLWRKKLDLCAASVIAVLHFFFANSWSSFCSYSW